MMGAHFKTCKECNASLPASAFYAHPKSADRRQDICKDCHKQRMKLLRRTRGSVQDRDRSRSVERRAAERKPRNYQPPEMRRAHAAVNNAVRDGRLIKEPCVFCAATHRLQAHHRDYSKPLDVVWLCARCHSRLHANFPELKTGARDDA